MSPSFLHAKKLAVLCLLIGSIFSLTPLHGQTYVVNGNATDLGGGCYRLTTANNSQAGSVWYQNKLNLDYNFQIEANLFLGNNDGGADGIAFVLQPVCTGLGGIGGGIGYLGISPSLAVEYDTWQNGVGTNNDPAGDHVGLQKNGILDHSSASNLAGPFVVSNLENGVYHPTVISWNAGTQTLTVTLDYVLLFSYVGNIKASIFSGNPNVFWGFTAATGAANNLQQVCISNVSFTELTPYSITDASCAGSSDGAINLMETGASYLWNTGATTQDLSGVSAGNYSVAVTDGNGCVSHYSMTVGVVPDVTPPSIACPANITTSNESGLCSAEVNYTAPVGTDNCSASTAKTGGLGSGSDFPVGTTTEKYTVTDGAGLSASCSFTVTVNDTEDPSITCPADITVNNDPGECGAMVFYTVPSYSDNCSLIPASLSGYTLLGNYGGSRYFRSNGTALSIIARNAAVVLGGHLATVTSVGENNFLKNASNWYSWLGFSDRVTEGVYVWETGETPTFSNWYPGEPNNFNGNQEDFAAINFGAPGSWNDENDTYALYWIVEFDGLGVLEPNIGKGSGSFYPLGTTTLTYQATDLHGNSADCTFDITVVDNEDPTIVCPAPVAVDTDPGSCEATGVVLGSPSIGDNCTGASASNNAPSSYVLGANTVTWTVLDGSNNSATCDQTVTVSDHEDPDAVCQGISVNADGDGNYPIDANLVNDNSSDNCGIASISVYPALIPCFHESTMQTVTLTVEDTNGNLSTCTATVTLLDDEDCDGVGDSCDLCPGGNDQVDNNGDGYPDCAYFPGMENLIEEWTCGMGDGKVLICHIPPGEPENAHTICVAPSAVAAHLAHGDYVGPCGNASCDLPAPAAAGGPINFTEEMSLHLYPNPANEQIILDLHGAKGKTATIQIFDNLGKAIATRTVGELTDTPFSLDLTSYTPGIYYLSVNVDGNTLEIQRFSVIR